jgi:hypothetical protein
MALLRFSRRLSDRELARRVVDKGSGLKIIDLPPLVSTPPCSSPNLLFSNGPGSGLVVCSAKAMNNPRFESTAIALCRLPDLSNGDPSLLRGTVIAHVNGRYLLLDSQQASHGWRSAKEGMSLSQLAMLYRSVMLRTSPRFTVAVDEEERGWRVSEQRGHTDTLLSMSLGSTLLHFAEVSPCGQWAVALCSRAVSTAEGTPSLDAVLSGIGVECAGDECGVVHPIVVGIMQGLSEEVFERQAAQLPPEQGAILDSAHWAPSGHIPRPQAPLSSHSESDSSCVVRRESWTAEQRLRRGLVLPRPMLHTSSVHVISRVPGQSLHGVSLPPPDFELAVGRRIKSQRVAEWTEALLVAQEFAREKMR